MATIAELEAAEKEFTIAENRWENYDGNNPNKHRAALSDAMARVSTLRQALKATGELPLTEHEKLEQQLDGLYPNAQSKQIVEFEGRRYRRTFTPVSRSFTGKTVKAWQKSWFPLSAPVDQESR